MITASLQVKQEAARLGFLACGISAAGFLVEQEERLGQWLRLGMHGEMGYMESNVEKRLDPRLLVDGAKSVISVLLNYYPTAVQTDRQAPVLSKYAYGKDYHFVMKDKLNALLHFIQQEIAPCNGRSFTDSAPVLDRAWAVRAGLGWIGKNTNLISVEHGSFFFIGELITDIDLEPDTHTVRDHCGNCTRCIDACPTKAIVPESTVDEDNAPDTRTDSPYFMIDARKCISYQTIELKGDLDETLRGKFVNRVFGCDICQDVCPWNLKAKSHNEPEFEPRRGLMEMSCREWQEMDKPLFDKLFRKSAVKRAKFQGIKRNLRFIAQK